ncbi:hypothetical protein [Nocardioides sp. LS1]|uniref:hypothetical protein n=1 Tax=Nocardioides sp. LS1 TaxID=1027620 RepID=UPI000FFA559A|nr:hypothetical protein [Nocardioides sp. LS1]GCD90545.1 hypothetical protein NLS1_25510 [Nocardioides sp. LS1]
MTTLSGTTHRPSSRARLGRTGTGLAALGLAAAGTFGLAGAASAVTQASAESQFSAAGITWSSSGNCTTRSNSTCTSFDGIRQATIDGARTLKGASGCALNITGGTEVGHASGTYSHYNGYKLDFTHTTCLTSWVHNTYTSIGLRGDGAPQYQAASGNIYADEGSHWDVTYYTCGC